MIRILVIFSILSIPILASEQYSESICGLIKQQMHDYEVQYGSNSQLYNETKNNYLTHCKNPKPSKIENSTLSNIKTYENVDSIQAGVKHKIRRNTIDEKVIKPNEKIDVFKPLDIVWKIIKLLIIVLIISIIILLFRKYSSKNIIGVNPNSEVKGDTERGKHTARTSTYSQSHAKGLAGEMQVNRSLHEKLDAEHYHLHTNITLPLEDGGTTQVDHIVVSEFGLFVIETKNLTGWIFGYEKEDTWRQVINRNNKHTFQNPLRQNYLHIRTLAKLLDVSHSYLHSVVIFTSKSQLKNKMPKNVGSIKDMIEYIKSFDHKVLETLSISELNELIKRIKLTANEETEEYHKDYLRDKFS